MLPGGVMVSEKGDLNSSWEMLERTLSSWRPGDVVGRASWNELAEPGMDDRIARWGSAGGLRVGICDGSKARDQRSGSEVHGGGLRLQ